MSSAARGLQSSVIYTEEMGLVENVVEIKQGSKNGDIYQVILI